MTDSGEAGDFLVVGVIVPVILLVLRTLLGNEISYWVTVLSCYLHRPFDLDNRVDTHDWCMLYNPGDGTWSACSLTFHFGMFRGKNGVYVHRYDENWDLVSVQRVPFVEWKRDVKKAHMNRENLPAGLREKLALSNFVNNY